MKETGTVSQFAIRAVIEALAHANIPSEPILRASGLAPELVDTVDARFPFDRARDLWERTAIALGDPDFGIHTAERLVEGYDLLDYLIVTSRTILEGYERLARFVRLSWDGSDFRVIHEGDRVRLVRQAGPQHGRQYDDFAVALIIVRGRRASGHDFAPRSVAFVHERPANTDALVALYRCPLTFGAPALEIVVDRADVARPSLRADSSLHELLEEYARTRLAHLPVPRDLAATVRTYVVRALPRDLPTIEDVARDLKMSARSLQRRLREQDTTYHALVDDVRRELALQYLANAALSIGEVTYLLHFSEVAAFARAFKRWMRVTPAEHRAHLFGR